MIKVTVYNKTLPITFISDITIEDFFKWNHNECIAFPIKNKNEFISVPIRKYPVRIEEITDE